MSAEVILLAVICVCSGTLRYEQKKKNLVYGEYADSDAVVTHSSGVRLWAIIISSSVGMAFYLLPFTFYRDDVSDHGFDHFPTANHDATNDSGNRHKGRTTNDDADDHAGL